MHHHPKGTRNVMETRDVVYKLYLFTVCGLVKLSVCAGRKAYGARWARRDQKSEIRSQRSEDNRSSQLIAQRKAEDSGQGAAGRGKVVDLRSRIADWD